MKVNRELSHACSEELLDLAEALVAYGQAEFGSKCFPRDLFLDLMLTQFRQVWPFLDVYHGHTHLRVLPFGYDARRIRRFVASVYLDLSAPEPARAAELAGKEGI